MLVREEAYQAPQEDRQASELRREKEKLTCSAETTSKANIYEFCKWALVTHFSLFFLKTCACLPSWGRGSNKQPWEAQRFSKIALFLVPQRRLAPPGDNHPCGRRGSGTLKGLVSKQPCQALLETAPGLRAGFWANPFVLQMKEVSPYVPSIPLLGIYIQKN